MIKKLITTNITNTDQTTLDCATCLNKMSVRKFIFHFFMGLVQVEMDRFQIPKILKFYKVGILSDSIILYHLDHSFLSVIIFF